MTVAGSERALAHPLEPLDRDELERAAEVALASLAGREPLRLVDVALREPHKEQLLSWEEDPARALPREASVVALERSRGATWELIVSLDEGKVLSISELAGVQPAITPQEFAECERVVRADPGFQQALRQRGIERFDLVTVEAWGIGTHAPANERSLRLAWTPCWVREDPDDNPYAHPIDGLFAIVDLLEMRVLRVEDHGSAPIPPSSGRYRPDAIGVPLREDLRPLEISQPEGPSFTVDGRQVRWQRWSLRIGFTNREGLVLHRVRYEDGGRERSILHRASYGELIVPYADPGPGGYRKCAFDIGEYGLGPLTNSLKLGCDCLGEIRYFDVDLCDERGRAYTIENAICMHEEDFGVLWKHYDAATDHAEVRRARRLVISSIITAANYEYALYWYLYQDGTIEAEVKATGIVLTQGENGVAGYGTRIAPGLVAPHHQHFFCVRLDMDVDGQRNTVYEVDTEAVPRGEHNPHGNAFRTVQTPLARESDARRVIDPLRARHWKVANENVRNALGEAVAYKLVPHASVLPFADPESDLMRRAGFLRAHLWVTREHPGERFPAGEYPNQHPGGGGLPEYQAGDRPLLNEDVVLWYTFASHHIVRPEDWPVMPVERLGFALKPVGFFDRNPALDVPPSNHSCEGMHGTGGEGDRCRGSDRGLVAREVRDGS